MNEQAGRELDARVAEKVMGLIAYKVQLVAPLPRVRTMEELQRIGSPLPHYSTSIEAAWEVVERLIALHFHEVQVRHWVDPFDAVMPQGWMCQCEGDNLAIVERATTAPLAICLAALKAVDK